MQCSSAATVLQGESLHHAGAQQQPSGWGPREMQPAVPENLPKMTGEERPWAPLGSLGIAWCQRAARHRAVLRTKGGWVDGWRG